VRSDKLIGIGLSRKMVKMCTAIVIRQARLDERDRLEALQRHASLAREEDRQALLAHPDAIELPSWQIVEGHVWVAERNEAAIGFSVVLPLADDEIELDGLFVEPHAWGTGIGRRLVEHAAGLTAARSMRVIANPGAAGFYAACGFEPAGEVQTRFGLALLMHKRLAVE
jgi:GNAT superfamily N-acetyltransferase